MRPSFASWTTHVYNPWLSRARLLRGARAFTDASDDFSLLGNRAEVIQLNKFANLQGERARVFAGPWCRALTDEVDRETRAAFWELIRVTPAIDWFLLFDGAFETSIKVPADWDDGYANCWVGVKLAGPTRAAEQLDALRAMPARHRFAVAAPFVEDLGDLNLLGLDWFMAQLSDERQIEPDAVTALKLQCMAYGVRFWLEEVDALGGKQGTRFSFREEPAP